MFKCPECGKETAYVIAGDDEVREFDRQFNAILENVNWLSGRAQQSDRIKVLLRGLLGKLVNLNVQWNETIIPK